MPEFIVRVGTPDGTITERHVQAMSIRAAEDDLRQQGMHVFDARRGSIHLRDLLPRGGKVISTEMFLLFNQELLALVKAGLPILQSFDIMLERQKNLRFKEVLTDVRDKLKSGIALSDAFASYGDAFPADLLDLAARRRALGRPRGRSAALPPLPEDHRQPAEARHRRPDLPDRPHHPVDRHGVHHADEGHPEIRGVLRRLRRRAAVVHQVHDQRGERAEHEPADHDHRRGGRVFLFRRWISTSGRIAWDSFKLHIPLSGGILHRFAIMQFTQSLGTLLAGGTPMVPAIEIASQSVTNQLVASKIFGMVQNVREGEPLWRSLENTGAMSDLAVEMIKVGESTGALTEMLGNVSEFYDEEIESRLTRMVAAIEPLILVFMGVVIAILLYAFYLPLFQLSNVAQ